MKKLIVSLLLVTVLVLSGCTGETGEEVVDETTEVVTPDTSEEVVEDTTEPATDEVAEEVEAVEPFEINVVTPYGTPALSMAKMMVEEPAIVDYVTINYETIQATDVLSAKLINNEADIAIIPTNLAANLYNKGVEYKLAGSSVWGIFYLVASEEITSFEDLKGKTISLFGQNLTPDALTRYVLTQNGIDPDADVTLEYLGGTSELAASYIAGESTIVLIPEPVLTNVLSKKEDSKVIFDMQEEWGNATGLEKYPMASIVVSEALINEHPEVVDMFLAEYEMSVAWLNMNPAEAGAYYEELNIGLTAGIIENAIEGCNLNYVPAVEAKDALNAYLDVLYDFNPQLLGGDPVNEELYYAQ